MPGLADCYQIMNTRMTGTPPTTYPRPTGDARVDRLAGDVRLAIGTRLEAMRAHRAALAEHESGLWEEPDRTPERDARHPGPRPLVPKRLTDGLRRNLP
jgi:hypothetical protein